MEIKISIALVTRNRSESLQRTLESLAKQSLRPYEIVVSDDSDQEDELAKNQALARQYSCLYVKGPKRGLYANRNFVAQRCSGTHIRTMDDDHEFPEGHIEECIKAVEKDRNAIWVIGEYYPWESERPIPVSIAPGQLHPRGYSYVPSDMENYYGISCGATIYPRVVVDTGILNAEVYKFGVLYLEYGARLSEAGYKIRFLDKTYVLHHYDPQNRSISSSVIDNSSRIFSMLMFSFQHKPTVRNKFLTVFQVLKDVAQKKYSFQLVKEVYHTYKQEKQAPGKLEQKEAKIFA